MSERISDNRLSRIVDNPDRATRGDTELIAAELRERRAADLSAKEVSALALLRMRIPDAIDCCPRHDAEYVVGIAALDKLTRSGK